MNHPVRSETSGTRSLIERAASALASARSLMKQLKQELPPEDAELVEAGRTARRKLKKANAALKGLQRAWDARVERTDC